MSEAELDVANSKRKTWYDYTKNLLESIDDNSILVKQFHYLTPTASSGEGTLPEKMHDFTHHIDKDVNNLQSIYNGLDLMTNSKTKSSNVKKDKKRTLTSSQKTWMWENKSRICIICKKEVKKQSDAHYDHIKPHVKGEKTIPAKMAITHAHCNRLKGKKSLRQIQKELGTWHKIKKKSKNENHSEKSILIKQNPYDEKAHLQNLNIVYQKLAEMRVWEMGDNTWARQVPVELGKDQLEYVDSLPDLNRALQHLEKNESYKGIFDSWNDLELRVKKYNMKISKFVSFLDNYIRETMSKKTKYVELGEDQEGYSVHTMRKAIMILLPLQLEGILLTHTFDLKIVKVYNFQIQFEYETFADTLFLVTNGNPEEIRDEIGNLLLEFARDKTILEKYKPYDKMQSDMFLAENQFQQKIDPLVYDIKKNGVVVEGKCDLPY